jgi:hypothetical protein
VCLYVCVGLQEREDHAVVLEAFMSKKGRFNRGWKMRLFRLLAVRGGGAEVPPARFPSVLGHRLFARVRSTPSHVCSCQLLSCPCTG